jgi:hypothetical protein
MYRCDPLILIDATYYELKTILCAFFSFSSYQKMDQSNKETWAPSVELACPRPKSKTAELWLKLTVFK